MVKTITCTLTVGLAVVLEAATITLTAPVADINVADAQEYFTDVMNNPMDFDKRRDIMWEENFDETSIAAANGVWNGTYLPDAGNSWGGYVFPLFQGHGGVDGALNAGLTGMNYPLESSKYRFVALKSSVSDRSVNALHWTRDGNWPDGSLAITGLDCYWTNTAAAMHPNNKAIIYMYDLSTNAAWTDANITGVRHDASTNKLAGTNVSYEWFRIIDPDSSEVMNITWSTADMPSLPTTPHVKIFVDTDNAGFDGALLGMVRWGESNINFNGALAQIPYNLGSFSFPTAVLPSGTYYFYLELFDNNGADTFMARSEYSAPLIVNTAGQINFEHPSMTSGEDYATAVLGDPWDMAGSSDVVNLSNPDYQKNFIDATFADGAFAATAIIPEGSTQLHTDAQVWLHVDPTKPIDTSRYHYLSYTLSVDDTYYTNISDKVKYGWVTRAIWWNSDIATDGTSTKANVTYEGVHTYSYDLRPMSVPDPYDTYPTQDGWLAGSSWSHLRIDPLETNNTEGTRFFLHDAKLTADPEPDRDGRFRARFRLFDPDGDTMQVKLYADTDRSNFDGVEMGTGTFGSGDQTLTIDTCSLAAGSYYLYAVVTDSAGNITKRYADVPVAVSGVCKRTYPAILYYLLN